jgi:hypothetical protein
MSGRRSSSDVLILFVSLVPVLIVAFIAPTNVLSSFATLEKFTHIFRDVLPAIDRLATVSSFPEVTKLVLSIEWILVPVQVVLFYLRINPHFNADQARAYGAYWLIGLFLLLGVSLWSTAIFYDVAPSDLQGGMYGESLLRLASTSRLGLTIVTSLGISVTALFMAVFCLWIRHLPDIYSRH